MGLQPSASRTALLLECSYPFGDVEIEPHPSREPARYGSAWHQIMAACLRRPLSASAYAKAVDAAAKRYDVASCAEELAGHVKSSLKVLQNWLVREKLEVVEVETAYAIDPNGKSRPIEPHDDEHRYDCRSFEVPSTVDLIARHARRQVILDHKTGHDEGFAKPAAVPQMRTLGLIDKTTEVAIFHADRQGLPIVYSSEVEGARDHRAALSRALSRVGDGSMRPGPWCGRCPASDVCPARSAEILGDATAALVRASIVLADEPIDPKLAPVPANAVNSVEDRAAALHELFKKLRPIMKAGHNEIVALVKAGRVVETREGALVLQTQTYETLSKKSVLEALGKAAGEREIERLRKKGAVRETTREMLVSEK